MELPFALLVNAVASKIADVTNSAEETVVVFLLNSGFMVAAMITFLLMSFNFRAANRPTGVSGWVLRSLAYYTQVCLNLAIFCPGRTMMAEMYRYDSTKATTFPGWQTMFEAGYLLLWTWNLISGSRGWVEAFNDPKFHHAVASFPYHCLVILLHLALMTQVIEFFPPLREKGPAKVSDRDVLPNEQCHPAYGSKDGKSDSS